MGRTRGTVYGARGAGHRMRHVNGHAALGTWVYRKKKYIYIYIYIYITPESRKEASV